MLCALVTASPKRLPTTGWRNVPARHDQRQLRRLAGRGRRPCREEMPAADRRARRSTRRSGRRASCARRREARSRSQKRPNAGELRLPVYDLVADRVCIHEFATRMKYADSHEAEHRDPERRQVRRGESRFQPKIQSPRNVASSMNAARPSIASGRRRRCPRTSSSRPVHPNWNSWTRPVATPIAKLIRKSVPKKCVSRSQRSSRVRCHIVCMTATSGPSPSVSGTKRSGRSRWSRTVPARGRRSRRQGQHESLGTPGVRPDALLLTVRAPPSGADLPRCPRDLFSRRIARA